MGRFGFGIGIQRFKVRDGSDVNPSNPYDLSGETFYPLSLDAWIIANSSLTGETIILPNVPRSYYSSTAFTTLDANNDVTFAGSTLADTDAIIAWYASELPSLLPPVIDLTNPYVYSDRTIASNDDIDTLVAAGYTVYVNGGASDIEFVASATNYGASVTELSCNVPTGTLDGHGMIAAVFLTNSGLAVNTPSGWSYEDHYNAATGTLYIFSRIASSEPANYTFNGWTSNNARVTIYTQKNIASSNFIDSIDVDRELFGNTVIGDAIVSSVDNTKLMFVIGCVLSSGTTFQASPSGVPSGMTAIENTASNYNTLACDEIIETAGSTGSRTATIEDSGNFVWAMILLKPNA